MPFPADQQGLSRRRFAAGGLASVLLAGCGVQRGTVLRTAELLPYDFPTSQSVLAMGERLEQLSGGELSIKLYAGSQLGSERDSLELATIGGVDLARVALAPLNAFEPLTFIPALPFMFRNEAHMRLAMDGDPGRKVLAALERHGLKGLCFYDSGSRSMYNTKRPIRTPDDMRGLKIRVQNSDLNVSLMDALGANATPMPLDEVYQALVQGVVDGAENNWPSYQSGRHYEVARFYSLTRHVIAPDVLVMSMISWRKLSALQQQQVMESAQYSTAVMHELWDKRVIAAEATVRAAGVQVNEVDDPQSFVEQVKPLWKAYASTTEQQNLVDEIQAIGQQMPTANPLPEPPAGDANAG